MRHMDKDDVYERDKHFINLKNLLDNRDDIIKWCDKEILYRKQHIKRLKKVLKKQNTHIVFLRNHGGVKSPPPPASRCETRLTSSEN